MIRSFLLISLVLTATQHAEEVDLVKIGSETFQNLGCAECHAITKNDSSVKTGPNLYGLFQKSPRLRELIESGENHKHSVKADRAYFEKSLRDPNSELAISEDTQTKGITFLPVMPAYPIELISTQKSDAIFHYLQTLNDPENQGPASVLATLEKTNENQNILENPNEILVTDRTRIFRARVHGSSSRAVYVGLPSGLNYAFDPRTFTITKIWAGGFLNLTKETSGRGNHPSSPGHQAQEIPLDPLPHNEPKVDLSFKSPLIGDEKTIAEFLNSPTDFPDLLKKADAQFLGYTYGPNPDSSPTFHYRLGKDRFSHTLNLKPNGSGELILSKNGQPTTTPFQLTLPASFWRPNPIPSTFTQQVALTPLDSLNLAPGYQGQRVPAPADPHGRPQLFEPMGIDLDPRDGSLVVSTRTAGLWRFKDNTWTLIAEGLLDSLGVIIEENRLVVGQKPELTALTDQDGDGFYETFQTLSDDFLLTENYHEYLHGPTKDAAGNYYYLLNLSHLDGPSIHKANGKFMGSRGGYRGWALQVTPDGKTIPFAKGLRSPAGLATGPDGQLYYADNQGEYNGTSKVYLLKKDAYYGHPSGLVDLPGMTPNSPEIHWELWAPKAETSIAITPHSRVANSPGSPVWDTTNGKFGPFQGEMFLGDQTLSTLFRVLLKDNHEAAIIHFAQGFPSGVMRMSFDSEGALYVGQTGRGWRARGGSEHALVKLTHSPSNQPQIHDFSRNGDTFTLKFIGDTSSLTQNPDLKIESYFFHDKPDYGSPENNKVQEKITQLEVDPTKGTVTFTLAPNPERQPGRRVFRLSTKDLPHNLKDSFEAFYTLSK